MLAGRPLLTAAAAAAILGGALSAPTTSDAGSVRLVGTLATGKAVYWRGQHLQQGSATYLYRLRLLEDAHLLRVGIDVPSRTDRYRVEVLGPGGRRAGSVIKDYAYNAEVYVRRPQAGPWRIEVTALEVTDSSFRMRAKLFGPKRNAPRHRMLPPDLRIIPPFDFTFSPPDDPYGDDRNNDPAPPPPPGTPSCTEDERAEEGAQRCLRFSMGIENAGAGPLDLRFDTRDPGRVMYQVVHRARGKGVQRAAGQFEYHPTHNHFHYAGIWAFSLFRVTNPQTGEMAAVGGGKKAGFCPRDQNIADWRSFRQARAGSVPSDCGMTSDQPSAVKGGPSTMGLSTGWGDVYGWYRPGNYVEFVTNGDGHYLVRAVADSLGNVLEGDESNNVAYALIEVSGETVRVIRRGLGTDPWSTSGG